MIPKTSEHFRNLKKMMIFPLSLPLLSSSVPHSQLLASELSTGYWNKALCVDKALTKMLQVHPPCTEDSRSSFPLFPLILFVSAPPLSLTCNSGSYIPHLPCLRSLSRQTTASKFLLPEEVPEG